MEYRIDIGDVDPMPEPTRKEAPRIAITIDQLERALDSYFLTPRGRHKARVLLSLMMPTKEEK